MRMLALIFLERRFISPMDTLLLSPTTLNSFEFPKQKTGTRSAPFLMASRTKPLCFFRYSLREGRKVGEREGGREEGREGGRERKRG